MACGAPALAARRPQASNKGWRTRPERVAARHMPVEAPSRLVVPEGLPTMLAVRLVVRPRLVAAGGLPPTPAVPLVVRPRRVVAAGLPPTPAAPLEVPPRLRSAACRRPGRTGCHQGSGRRTSRM